MKRIFILIWLASGWLVLHGQSFFNIQPDVGGNDMQGVCRNIILRDSVFCIIGHRYDTAGPGSNSKPWMGEFDYDGNLTFLTALIDSTYEKPFNANFLSVAHKEKEIYYVYSMRLIESPYTPYLFELNIKTGEILRSKLIPNAIYPTGYPINARAIQYINHTISLLSFVYVNDSVKIFITELDTLFNELEFIKIENSLKYQYPKFLKYSDNGNIIVIAHVRLPDVMGKKYYKFVYLEYGRDGKMVNQKIAPSNLPIGNGLSLAKCVVNNQNGDWVLSGYSLIEYPDSCMFCAVVIPYIFSVSADFDSLLWETRFFDIPYKVGPYYDVYSLTAVEDGYIATADFYNIDLDKFPDSGVLFKAGLNGDSLWMKHYIPLDWDEYRIVWGRFVDIKTTSFGSVIVAGEVSDRDNQIIRPWILHVDKDGCLVPGCNLVSNTEDGLIIGDKKKRFKIYPNPASSELYLLSTISNLDPIHLQVVSNTGVVLKSRDFIPAAGYQYSLPVEDLTPGTYHLILTDKQNQISESHSFIKQ